MTKNQLLLATAATALLSSGLAAHAGEITGTSTQYQNVRSTGTSTAYSLANEVRFSATATTASAFSHTQGNLSYTFLPDAGTVNGFPNAQQLLMTLDITGAVFYTASTSGQVVGVTGTNCTASVNPVTNVASGGTSASYLVTLTSCTTSSTGVTISLPIQVTGANSVTAGIKLEQSFGGSLLAVDGGRKQATFITSGDAFTATITPGTTTSVANVTGGYNELLSTTSVGTVTVAAASGVNKDLAGTTATFSDIAGIRVSANATSGDFTGFNLISGATRFSTTTVTATTATLRVLSVTATAQTTTVSIATVDNTATATSTAAVDLNGVISPTSITLSADIDLVTNDSYGTSTGQFVDFSVAPTSSFAIVSRNGASFVAPWTALNSTTLGTIRLANNGTTATGPIRVTLLSNNAGTTPTTTSTVMISQGQLTASSVSLTGTGGIPAGASVAISGAALATAFGTTAGNGDISVSIEAAPNTVSAKHRTTTANNGVFESSLGNLSN